MGKVTNFFEQIGLVKVETEAPVAPPPAPTELATEAVPQVVPSIAPEQFAGTTATAEEEISFADIYAKAGVEAPAHGFTVDKLIEMMGADEFRDMDRPTLAKVISGMLKRLPGGPVPVEDIVRDASSRDKALDAFERFRQAQVAKLEADLLAENRALQDKIDQVYQKNNQKMAENREQINAEKAAFEAWKEKKEAEENRLFEAIRPFVMNNPITRGSVPQP